MSLRSVPKLIIWILLTCSASGAISSWLQPNAVSSNPDNKLALEQQMAQSTATYFAREWMTWSGDESPEDRLSRLKPYVSISALNRISQMKVMEKGSQQRVIAAEFISLTQTGGHLYSVRIRVIAVNPTRTTWEMNVLVAVQGNKGSSVVDSPVIRPVSDPPVLSSLVAQEPAASNEVKQRMRPTIESFVRAFYEGKDADSLVNYVSNGTIFIPLQGRLKVVSIDDFLVYGHGPYDVKVSFTVQDEATGFSFSQTWTLQVTEENQKFFVSSME
jgi:hypothetical protein